jgi:hypothetical protein
MGRFSNHQWLCLSRLALLLKGQIFGVIGQWFLERLPDF